MTSPAPRFGEQDIEYLDIDFGSGVGQAVAWPVRSGFRVRAVCDALADDASQRQFVEWATQRVEMLLTIGPDADGWFRRSDGGWQIQARSVYAPSLDEPGQPAGGAHNAVK